MRRQKNSRLWKHSIIILERHSFTEILKFPVDLLQSWFYLNLQEIEKFQNIRHLPATNTTEAPPPVCPLDESVAFPCSLPHQTVATGASRRRAWDLPLRLSSGISWCVSRQVG